MRNLRWKSAIGGFGGALKRRGTSDGPNARLEPMQYLWRRRAHASSFLALLPACAALFSGCASPGPPHPPSLQLPRLISDLSATREGDVVHLRFTVPNHTTDNVLLRDTWVTGELCRQIGSGPCVLVDGEETKHPLAVPTGDAEPVVWMDVLPAALISGPERQIVYRVQLRNSAGRSAGYSDPAFTAAGPAPAPVTGFTAEGTRLGVELGWVSLPGAEVLLQRTGPAMAVPRAAAQPKPASSGKGEKRPRVHEPEKARPKADANMVWLQAAPGDRNASATMDASVAEGVPYTYVAIRRETAKLGNRTVELRSAPSAAVSVVWRDVYPPPVPAGLTALGYQVPAPSAPGASQQVAASTYAVDLVWQPVNDPRLAGYVVYRQALSGTGEPVGERTRFTPQPIVTPAFHDGTAVASTGYRYGVSAIDAKGNESRVAETTVQP